MSLRQRYLDNADTEIDFHAYYGALVEHIGEAYLRGILPGHRTAEEWSELLGADEHLNNVPLRQWDAMDPFVRPYLGDKEALKVITGSGGWSLSDSVCVLKETARRYAATTNQLKSNESPGGTRT